jgi:DNA-binding beta-propeller fold protein YncE
MQVGIMEEFKVGKSVFLLTSLRMLSHVPHGLLSLLCAVYLGLCPSTALMSREDEPIYPSSLLTASGALRWPKKNTPTAYIAYFDKRLNFPSDLAVNEHEIIFVADCRNHVIRKITPEGTMTTLAGKLGLAQNCVDGCGTSAMFIGPGSLVLNPSGDFYTTDQGTIRKITSNGKVTTVAGNSRYEGFSDGEGANARFNLPSGIVVAENGDLYIADSGNQVIRKITPDGNVTTFAGVPNKRGADNGPRSTALFYGPFSIAMDGLGNIYVGESFNHAIRKISVDGMVSTLAGDPKESGSADGLATAARFSSLGGLAVDKTGTIFVSDSENHTIRKITPEGMVSTLAGSAGITGREDGTGTTARFNRPAGIALNQSGNIYVVDSCNHAIRKITPEGVVSTVYGDANVEKAKSKQRQ